MISRVRFSSYRYTQRIRSRTSLYFYIRSWACIAKLLFSHSHVKNCSLLRLHLLLGIHERKKRRWWKICENLYSVGNWELDVGRLWRVKFCLLMLFTYIDRLILIYASLCYCYSVFKSNKKCINDWLECWFSFQFNNFLIFAIIKDTFVCKSSRKTHITQWLT